MRAPTKPPSTPVLVPPAALEPWLALARLLEEVRTPCQADPAPFHGPPGDAQAAAEACAWCPVLAACGAYADAADESYGVWAGVDRSDRRGRGKAAA